MFHTIPNNKEGCDMETEKKKWVSVCGTICEDCEHYQESCLGCKESSGKAFWLHNLGLTTCKIYQCCTNYKKLKHCGNCHDLPCEYYEQQDPTKSLEENQKDFLKQMENLNKMD